MKKAFIFILALILLAQITLPAFAQTQPVLVVGKRVINFTSGNLNWSNYIIASPGDTLGFSISLQAGNQDVHNVVVKDALPSNLILQNGIAVTGAPNYSGNNIVSGITISTIPARQIVVIGYQAQVAQNTLGSITNIVAVTSQEAGSQTAFATVSVQPASNPTNVPTGLTNNFFTDSFLLPLVLIILGMWFYFSGKAHNFATRIKS